MSTTALYVELLIIGIQVSIWLSAAAALVFGVDRHEANKVWSLMADDETMAIAALLVIAYVLGIIGDKVCKLILACMERGRAYLARWRGWSWLYLGYWWSRVDPEGPGFRRQSWVMAHASELEAELIYARSKVRILRALCFNAPLAMYFVVRWTSREFSYSASWWLFWLGLLTWAVVITTYSYNDFLYDRRVRGLNDALRAKATSGMPPQ